MVIILKSFYPKKIQLKVRVYNEEPSFGKGIILLLEGIEKYGSIKEACSHMKMAKSKGFKIINRAQKDLNIKLVESETGGKNGGHSYLTEEAKELMKRYHWMMNDIEKASEDAFKRYFL